MKSMSKFQIDPLNSFLMPYAVTRVGSVGAATVVAVGVVCVGHVDDYAAAVLRGGRSQLMDED
jgi:hypothetical protein